MWTISNIFALQTHFQHQQCGQRQQEETLGLSSWTVNVYWELWRQTWLFTEHRGRHGPFDGLSWVADSVFIMHSDFSVTPFLFVYEQCMTSRAVCSESIVVNKRPDVISASWRHAWSVYCNLHGYVLVKPNNAALHCSLRLTPQCSTSTQVTIKSA